ncbi:hypothetical protein Vafri_3151 [Volvox africanus]|uniref:CCHC-type domain-containing protein n=1 Tax=Volvox africanus TaxID=51714 RepID=A0A8J4AQX7_9CHLO|nr:hypothetical protein Vafri_3151 [Volvox africanus]
MKRSLHRSRSQLRQEYTKLAMKKGEALPVYLARVRELHTDLLKVGQATSEQDMTYAMLTGLPQKYEVIVSILTTQSGELTLSSATAQLLAFEARVGSMHEASTSSSAFVSAGRGSSATGSAPRRGGSHVRGGSREPLQCWNCGKPGHLERGCTAPRMAQRSGSWSSAPRGPGYGSGGLEHTRMGGHGEAAGGPSLGSDRRGYGRHDHVDGAGDRGNSSPRNFAFVASASVILKTVYTPLSRILHACVSYTRYTPGRVYTGKPGRCIHGAGYTPGNPGGVYTGRGIHRRETRAGYTPGNPGGVYTALMYMAMLTLYRDFMLEQDPNT